MGKELRPASDLPLLPKLTSQSSNNCPNTFSICPYIILILVKITLTKVNNNNIQFSTQTDSIDYQ